MHQVTIHEAKTNLSRLIREVLRGEEVIIARGKTPLVRLAALPGAVTERRLDGLKDLVTYIGDDFDAPLEDFAEYAP